MTVAVFGEALIDLLINEGGSFDPFIGGSPFNVAIALARLGVDVDYLAPFSDDIFGLQLRAAILAEGVGVPITRSSRLPTSLALVSVDQHGKPAYRIYREGIADKDIGAAEVMASISPKTEIFHTGSLAITPDQLGKVRGLLEMIKSKDILISIDLNIRLGAYPDVDSYLSGVRSLIPLADIVKASDEDLQHFAVASSSRDIAESIYSEMESGIFILTEGASGAITYTSAGITEAGAWAVEDIEDTIGAGDTFHSGFLAALIESQVSNLKKCSFDQSVIVRAMDFGAACAALNLSQRGCNPPKRLEVESLVAKKARK